MITPNKVISLDDSVLGHVSWILEEGPHTHNVVDLFDDVSDKFESADQFLLALDVLFVLGRISVDFETRMVIYAA